MNQYALFHFSIQKDNRFFQFSAQPGTTWSEMYAGLDQIKKELGELQEKAEKFASENTPSSIPEPVAEPKAEEA